MADEIKQEQPTPIDPNNPPAPIAEQADKSVRELRETPVDDPAQAQVEAVLNKPVEAIEDAANQLDRATKPQTPAESLAPAHNRSETHIFGRVIPYPLYTVVFFTLGVITIIEVVIAEVFPEGLFKTIPLVVLSLAKAVMVVMFYMHLKEDSRIFAFTLILPLLIALVSALFLLSVPITGY
ncbi:MAG: cytochrome C oxidase subunit IV family protein [Anaerolineae bacterium]|jgi:cytochrome c oxidase subunit IV|uniref:cytochrome C oxidase subunit IV family protein n=1 Tax=Candidatus Flexifilum breve TaxID=3140694 RepID=UPI001AD3848E|nr:cytochrome C oxidase subunit IV family protein [Chloroflexota bacterium]MBK9747189.1 cytochrome C oxidase subunit IV family protein [Chloroflexota bacterium]MBN8637534.1 cytochrome C oxidase subunit IV family protein [Anaerolineae bacterium]